MDRLDEFFVFTTILDTGSLAATARRLRRSPPAVTRSLAALEGRVGTRLLQRTTRQLTSTEAGRRLASHARQLLADYQQAVGSVGVISTDRSYCGNDKAATIAHRRKAYVRFRPSETSAERRHRAVIAPDEVEAAANRPIALQTAEQTTLARLTAGDKLPDITGVTAMLKERMAKG
jgi:Bacterial regulatory helix-turn-helix protein, lysR family